MCNHDAIQCFVPPYIVDNLVKSPDPKVRARAIAQLKAASTMRAFRIAAQAMPTLMAAASPTKKKFRQVYDAKKGTQLPGTLIRGRPGDGVYASSDLGRVLRARDRDGQEQT